MSGRYHGGWIDRCQSRGPESPHAMPATRPRRAASQPRNPARTRSRLLAAGVKLFAARGFHGVAVDEIVAAARCNKRMLYHYFGDKEGLYVEVLRTVYARMEARRHDRTGDPRGDRAALRVSGRQSRLREAPALGKPQRRAAAREAPGAALEGADHRAAPRDSRTRPSAGRTRGRRRRAAPARAHDGDVLHLLLEPAHAPAGRRPRWRPAAGAQAWPPSRAKRVSRRDRPPHRHLTATSPRRRPAVPESPRRKPVG
ncbi:MAG: TetR/AcrR family transcriptional regulator [Planctomycetia bacterium]|nr:TetR/AcrR family transcriptional regulator [Planctomycetia bacterium]